MIKQTLWRKAYELKERERERYWEHVKREPSKRPEDMTLLYATVKEFEGHTIIHEHMAGDDQSYLLATTRYHLRDQLFQAFYEARFDDMVRTYRRLTKHNNRSHVTLYPLKNPEDL